MATLLGADAVVIFHAECMDGTAAAWSATRKYPNATVIPAGYGSTPPWERLAGKHVMIVDFSYPRPVLEQIGAAALSLRVFDHHKTASEDLAGFPGAVFDMERSGAGITWDELFGYAYRPWLVDYVEDRDLWRYRLPSSREINAYVGTQPYTIEAYDSLAGAELSRIKTLGEGAWTYLQGWAQAMAHGVVREVNVTLPDGRTFAAIPVANCAPKGGSELLEIVGRGKPWCAMWFRSPQGLYNYGLRSAPDGEDVSAIARLYGGGGHPHAAGFRADRILWETDNA